MQGLMQDYPLTLPHVFHRVERLFPKKGIVTALPLLLFAAAAQRLLAEDWGVQADVWSVTSWNEMHRDGLEVEKERLRHPDRHRQPNGLGQRVHVHSPV